MLLNPARILPTVSVIAMSLLGTSIGAETSQAAPGNPSSGRPNIVLIFADDLGWKDVGYNGSDFYETPHLDKLAAEGMVFHDAYAAAGNCAPSRACLLSGTYTPRHHVYAVGSTDRGPKRFQRLIPVPSRSGLPQSTVTIADALKAAGYATGIFGKWHLSGRDGATPAQQGFETVFDSREGNPNAKRDQPDDPKGIFSITQAACDFMKASGDRPFFAYVSHHAIHSALEARPETLKRFEEKSPGEQHRNALYGACTYDLDAGVGQLLAMLDELKIADNTLVVFTSDNGATQQSSQEPLRGSKGGYYEGGIREPMIVRWPGVTTAGSECRVPVINVDLFPTFLAAAGVQPSADVTLDGENLLPLLTGSESLQRSAIFWHFPGYLDKPVIRGREEDQRLGFRTRPVTVIRKGEWKLHLFHEEWQLDGGFGKLAANKAVELYHLGDDVGERHDLAKVRPLVRDELIRDLLAWQQQTGAIMPTEANPLYRKASGDDSSPRGKSRQKGMSNN